MEHLLSPVEAESGDTVEVNIDRPANVRLLTRDQYDNDLLGRPFEVARGGYNTTSPVRLPIPHFGRWNLVDDLGGKPGQVRASVDLLTAGSA